MEFKESGTDSGTFTKIVDTFIRSSSPFEVNISSRTKTAILQKADAGFGALSLVRAMTRSAYHSSHRALRTLPQVGIPPVPVSFCCLSDVQVGDIRLAEVSAAVL